MAVLTKSGRTALAASLREQIAHLAWGTGSPLWENSFTQDFTFVENVIQLPQSPVKNVEITHATANILPEHYTVNNETGVITRTNMALPDTVTIAYTVDTPQEDDLTDSLLNEVGRRLMDIVDFCVPDEEGELVMSTGRFSVSTEPTNHLYFRTSFDFTDAATETIRELGIFIGTQVAPGLPPGQRYFTPNQLTNPGILLATENIPPLIRTEATREAFSFVVTL